MKLMFGWNIHTSLYHILKIGKGLTPHLSDNEKAQRMFVTLCPRKTYNAIQFLDNSNPRYLYPQILKFSDTALTINTLCKDCLSLYHDKDEVLSTLINIKLGVKYKVEVK